VEKEVKEDEKENLPFATSAAEKIQYRDTAVDENE
jgi:hypothetical protein